ncbi:outer dynein arm-docking complex subunit 1-like [Myxocyprinus asiaticus]|uniref:outer dynein arm-docking complex subunit 1-like n=1 Tax=Myxocyprinus asiaticus TaxID=70543 RepID=UPI002223DCEF|nr:outer dynein arm-docking complex subunit 1-like [Myxocyprinus asiaticus]XP_051529069.1 outer dynein arm-docking complex subunit 1-like [Myxocyprinus asiaticus]
MARGRSAVSVLSDSVDMDFDGIAETEIGKLQRQFRITEGDRQAYSIQSQEIIRKQRQEISKLREEQEELLRSLRVVECQTRKQSDSQDAQSLRSLLDQRDDLDEQLEIERQTQAELEQEILSVEKKLVELRRGEITASHSHKSQTPHTQKATHILENKLDRALVRFNEHLTKNSQLREEIETLRMERVQFQQLRRKLEKVLQDIRKDIGEVINMSTSAYDARVEAQTKMSMMKEKAVKDLTQYTAEMKELERVLANERRLKEFMTTKSNERSIQDDGQEMNRRHEMKEQRKADPGVETMDTLEEVFQRIQRVTGEDDLETLVTKFIQAEDRNFALFNYVNEQNAEAEKLREEIQQIGEEMKQFHMEGLQQEQKYQEELKRVRNLQKECEKQAQQYKAQADDISKILDQIKTGMDSLFDKLDCDQALEDDLGSSSGIRDSNIMKYLSLVEPRTTELLTIHAFINSKDQEKSYDPKELTQFLLGQTPDIQRQTAMVQPLVSRDDDEAEDSPVTDEEDRPLSEAELRQHIRQGVLSNLLTGGGRDVKTPKSSTMSSSKQHSLDA